jgi:hypothetical protein
MFQHSKTTKLPEWRELFDATTHAKVGDVLTHDQIAAALKLPRGGQKYFGAIQRWRREEMTQRHRQWKSIRATGYELQPSEQHRNVAAGHVKRSRRAARRAWSTLSHTDLDRMTDADRQQHINAEARAGVLYQIAQATEKEMRHLPAASSKRELAGSLPKPI